MNRRSFLKAAAATAAAAVLGLGHKRDEMAVGLGNMSVQLFNSPGIGASDVKRRMGELLAPTMAEVADSLDDVMQSGYLVPPEIAEGLLKAVAELRDIPGTRYTLRLDKYEARIVKNI